jgi:mRNA-degrading endonuclease HigB of HigAB toxin-antitoxin module
MAMSPLFETFQATFGIVMRIALFRELVDCEAMQQHPDAANEIRTWAVIVKGVRWHNFLEVRSAFKDVDNVKGYMIFNIRQNRYRLVTIIHYARTTN